MSQINWNENKKEQRLSAYANVAITQSKLIYDAYEKDGLDFLELAIWNPSIISGTKCHKPMFDCIKAFKERADNKFKTEKSDSLVRDIEDICWIDTHYHELIEDAFGCHVTEIDEHNKDPEWTYNNRAKYTQSEIDEAIKDKHIQCEGAIKIISSGHNFELLITKVLYFLFGFTLSWMIFA